MIALHYIIYISLLLIQNVQLISGRYSARDPTLHLQGVHLPSRRGGFWNNLNSAYIRNTSEAITLEGDI